MVAERALEIDVMKEIAKKSGECACASSAGSVSNPLIVLSRFPGPALCSMPGLDNLTYEDGVQRSQPGS